MSWQDEAFADSLRATFQLEARDHLDALAMGLVRLEAALEPAERQRLLDAMFRSAHSLKGAARAVNIAFIEQRCQRLEDQLASWPASADASASDPCDRLSLLLSEIDDALSAMAASAPPSSRSSDAMASADAGATLAPTVAAAPPGPSAHTVRVPADLLQAHLARIESLIPMKLAQSLRLNELHTLADRIRGWDAQWSSVAPFVRDIGAAGDDADRMHLADILEGTAQTLRSIERSLAAYIDAVDRDRYGFGKAVDELLEESKRLLVMPFSSVTAGLLKAARDLARDQGKAVAVVVHGESVTLDKRILDAIRDPLLHLLRNAIDHGVEPANRRLALGKSARATVTLSASDHGGRQVELAVGDDGGGIDEERLKAAALEQGVVLHDVTDHRTLTSIPQLAFEPRVSTRRAADAVSGRGLGLAIVREVAERLGGSVTLETAPGRGTRVAIIVPAAIATFRGVLVEAGRQMLIVPTRHVERIVPMTAGDVWTIEGRSVLSVEGRTIRFSVLSDLLDMPATETTWPFAIVVTAGDRRAALAIDEVHSEQEFLIRPLPPPLVRVRNASAACILGSGRVVPVLDVAELIGSAHWGDRPLMPTAPAKEAGPQSSSVLVVDDSLTSRLLFKSLFEAAGYRVAVAIDGADAWAQVQERRFDVIVTDLEMPRLDGVELTLRVRRDSPRPDVPIVLVTSSEDPADRRRAMDAGVSAYAVKSHIDRDELLRLVRRLS